MNFRNETDLKKMDKQYNKLILITAPSGAGKTSIVQRLLQKFQQLAFSVSATTRKPRGNEKDGADYYQSRSKIAAIP